jgi:hypothetical protein
VGGGAPIIDYRDCILPKERHHVASARVFIEFHTSSEGPRDHEILHHITVFEIVFNEVRVVWVGLLEKSLKVVYWWPRLVLVAVYGNRDAPMPESPAFLSCPLS